MLPQLLLSPRRGCSFAQGLWGGPGPQVHEVAGPSTHARGPDVLGLPTWTWGPHTWLWHGEGALRSGRPLLRCCQPCRWRSAPLPSHPGLSSALPRGHSAVLPPGHHQRKTPSFPSCARTVRPYLRATSARCCPSSVLHLVASPRQPPQRSATFWAPKEGPLLSLVIPPHCPVPPNSRLPLTIPPPGLPASTTALPLPAAPVPSAVAATATVQIVQHPTAVSLAPASSSLRGGRWRMASAPTPPALTEHSTALCKIHRRIKRWTRPSAGFYTSFMQIKAPGTRVLIE